jgi:hypothetical protein
MRAAESRGGHTDTVALAMGGAMPVVSARTRRAGLSRIAGAGAAGARRAGCPLGLQ